MSLRDIRYKAAYISGVDNLVREFYVPVLAESTLYQRRTGFFNSRALAMAARGLRGLLKNDGKMQLLCSVHLDEHEQAVLRDPVAYLERRAIDLSAMLEKSTDEIDRERLGVLAHLLATGRLEIRIALRQGGMYHEKAGIFHDRDGNIVAFNGSGNETPGGWARNTESFHAFTSWEDDRHIRPEMQIFDRLWNGRDPKTTVIPLPFAVVKGLIQFKDYFREGVDVDEPIDPGDPFPVETKWHWTPELAYVFEAPRLWNHRDFAYAETAVKPFQHQDYIASTVLERWPPRCMFADEVGLGKTIEAGLVIRGFLAAGRIDRMLVLAPTNVLKQWQGELYAKFGIEAWRLDGDYVFAPQLDPKQPAIREKVDAANPFRSKPILLVSSQLIRLEERKQQLLGLEYDLVVLDEAHHARARGPSGRREPNKLLQAMEELRYQTQGLILMTATPIQVDRKELWDLLNVLELPGKWQDENAFDRFFQTINQDDVDWAFLFDLAGSVIEAWGVDEPSVQELRELYPRIDMHRLVHLMRNGRARDAEGLSDEEKTALRILLYRHTPIRQMVFRNTRELLKRYRAEGKFDGKIADRNPVREEVELAGSLEDATSERGLYERIDNYVRNYYAKYNAVRKGLGFLMETYRKRLTSSMYAIGRSLERRHALLKTALDTGEYGLLLDGLDEDDLLDVSDAMIDQAEEGLRDRVAATGDSLRSVFQAEFDFLDDFLRDLRALPYDSKAEHMAERLRKLRNEGRRQIIIFSQFADTVQFLLDYFRPKYGNLLGAYTGAGGRYWDGTEWVACSKQEIQSKFTDPNDPLSILICTDAASEGLNLQTCDTLFNYDIPWNPMRIEQRIGRVDRIGQESPIVHIHTIFYKDTVETRVYDRCLRRINDFKSALGHLQPILQSTEAAIRRATLLDPKEAEAALAELDAEADMSVAQQDENLRIDRLLNHYSPRLPLRRSLAPISQKELEHALSPVLVTHGWTPRASTWVRGAEIITFDQTLLDRKGGNATYITPLFPLAKLFGPLPELPSTLSDKDRSVERLEVGGVVGLAPSTANGVQIAHRFADLTAATLPGRRYKDREEAVLGLKHLIQEQRDRFRESELKAWTNRNRNWEARARLYLDRVAQWRWRQATRETGLEGFPVEDFGRAWNAYLSDADRAPAHRLALVCKYTPQPGTWTRKRGAVSQQTPRQSERERQLIQEHERIVRRLELLSAER